MDVGNLVPREEHISFGRPIEEVSKEVGRRRQKCRERQTETEEVVE